jgi:hypothetical protein
MKLPENMMKMLRERRCLCDDDTSQDKEIEAMKPALIVRQCASWRLGDPFWADIFAGWMMEAGAKPEDF